MTRRLEQIATAAVVGVLLGVSASIAATPCTPLPVQGATWNPSTGEFNTRRPTSYGELLMCGQVAPNYVAVRAHFMGQTDIFELSTTSPGPNALMTLTFGSLGTMTYNLTLPALSRTLVSSTVMNCQALDDSHVLQAMKEAHDYYLAILLANVGTSQERDLCLTLVDVIAEYLRTPQLIADCSEALRSLLGNSLGCSMSSCTIEDCQACCSSAAEAGRRDCARKYGPKGFFKRVWWALFGESQDYQACMGNVAAELAPCGAACTMYEPFLYRLILYHSM
ncbi:MAG: hypothetical protein U0V87_10000 [Acidobacteriota bacterium]